jgi:hypothetical protein
MFSCLLSDFIVFLRSAEFDNSPLPVDVSYTCDLAAFFIFGAIVNRRACPHHT